MVRVRFAPSPTGYLHIGGLRTALYNYLFAKKMNGIFILRIEDTDRARFVEGAIENLISTLRWAGLDYDEGIDKDGGFAPYMQSQRLDIYQKHIQDLLGNKKAYYCFCEQARLTSLREEQSKLGHQPKYDKHCLKLTDTEIQNNLENKIPFVVRLNIPVSEPINFFDIVRGDVEFNSDVLDDQILMKSDGYPTYHLANVVDDHLMEITHVIRGEEWLSSTPKHILLYKFFNWEIPIFAHLPLLLNSDRSKLSKRQGDVAVEDYRAKGYLKEALVNFVGLLGWTAGDDKEYYELDEMINAFSLERVNKSGAVFDVQKLNWLNAEHLRKKPILDLLEMLKVELQKSRFNTKVFSDDYLLKIIDAMLPRVSFTHEFVSTAEYFFDIPNSYDEETIKKRWKSNSAELLLKYLEKIEALNSISKEEFEQALHKTAEENSAKNADLIHPLRLALSGVGGGPGVFDIAVILGLDEVKNRIKIAIQKISNGENK